MDQRKNQRVISKATSRKYSERDKQYYYIMHKECHRYTITLYSATRLQAVSRNVYLRMKTIGSDGEHL